jgi:hypothetical protein
LAISTFIFIADPNPTRWRLVDIFKKSNVDCNWFWTCFHNGDVYKMEVQ